MLESKSMENELSTSLLRVAIIGAEKNGKSLLASTAPGIKYFLDFDQRKEALAGKKGVYATTLKDPEWPKTPEVAEEVLDIMSALELSLDLANLKDKLGNRILPEAPNGTMINNLVFDSMSSFARCVMKYELYHSKDLRRELVIGNKLTVHIPRNYDAWNAEMSAVTSVIMRSLALPINIFCIFHEAAEEAVDSTDEKPKYTGRVSIYPVRYRSLLKYFNEVWRVKLTPVPVANGVRYLPRVYPLPDFSMDAATTMMLDQQEEPYIERMIEKHKKNLADLKGSYDPNRPKAAGQIPAAIAGVSK
jgi:autonomous glycyl radical cofactor GrcA